jgi:hypothetical protein
MSLRERLLALLRGERDLRLACQRRRWEVIRYRWPARRRVVSEYHRRRRTGRRRR